MSLTSTNYTSLSYIEEVTPGVTPVSPAFQLLPTTGGSPSGNITTKVSEVLRRDRQIDDLIVVDAEVGGEVKYELSYGPYKPILKALLQSTPVVLNLTAATLSVLSTNTYGSSANAFISAGVKVGMNVLVSGFANPANNGFKKVTAVTAGVMTVTGTSLVIVAAGPSITMKSTMVRNGAETPKTFTFMKFIEGLDDPAYFYYAGCMISKMNFKFETGSILNGSFDIVGREEEPTITAKSGQTLVDVPSYALMNSVSSITQIDLEGLPADTEFSTLNLTVNNNINRAKAIGTLGAVDMTSFTLNVTADITMYFNTLDTYNFYKNSESFYLAFTLVDGDGNILIVTMPKCKFEKLESPIEGKDHFLMLNGSLRALRDAVTNSTVQFEFFDAP